MRFFSWSVLFLVALFLGNTLVPPIPSYALAFTDVQAQTSYGKAIETLKNEGIIEGYDDGSFRPKTTINRAEFLKIVLGSRGGQFSGKNCFPDVKDEWYSKFICSAKAEGIVDGYPDGMFKPERTINFVEASKILSLAFKQDVNGYSTDWFEPYVLALESSKAIPPSIGNFDQSVNRGEMAEMMWRLTDGVDDQPSKGFLNVKHPELTVNTASDTPQNATKCSDLQFLGQQPGEMLYRGGVFDSIGAPMPSREKSEQAPTGLSGGGGGDDYSRTNIQVEGVDESDIVKVDGNYLYTVRGTSVHIVRANPGNDLSLESTIPADDSNIMPTELYLDKDQLVILGNGWTERPMPMIYKMMPGIYPPYYPSIPKSEVRIYDIADRAHPVFSRKLEFDGSLVSSRRIGDKLYLVMNQGMNWIQPLENPQEKDVLPQYKDSAKGTSEQPVTRCANVVILPHIPQPQYLVVSAVPLRAQGEVKSQVVVGSADNVYASTENLYVGATQWKYFWGPVYRPANEETTVYRFAFTPSGVEFKAQGSVPGHILNQFSMDEHKSRFRIATTSQETDAKQNSINTNNFYVLNMDLARVGSIEDIAPGEQIYSVRFMGDRAYMVTFKNTDPLFVIDTSDPANPVILGKLKIPGFSDYLHPYDQNHLIGFGKEAVDSKDGNFAWYQGMKIALFDVTDPSNPVEMSNVVIGDRGTYSPLLDNHKALLFDRDRGLLSFPISVSEISPAMKKQSYDEAAGQYGDMVFQGAYVYDVSLKNGFTLRGKVTHYTPDDLKKAGGYLYGKDVERIVRIGNSLLTLGQDGLKSVNEKTVEEEGTLAF